MTALIFNTKIKTTEVKFYFKIPTEIFLVDYVCVFNDKGQL